MKQTTQLRERLKENRIIAMPGAYNAIVAKQIEKAGFEGVYISGAGLSNSFSVPDTGILGLEDFVYMAGWITKAVDIPVICDADTGFSDVGLTVKRYIEAGIAGMHIEDQLIPKRCGHLGGKKVIGCEEMSGKIASAVKARNRYDKDFLIIARTDARGSTNISEAQQLEEAIKRGKAYLAAGADMTFPESLRRIDEFKRYKDGVGGLLLANMTEFGKTPFIPYKEFEKLGYNIAIFPVSLLRYHAGWTELALEAIKEKGHQGSLVPNMMSRGEVNGLIGYKPKK